MLTFEKFSGLNNVLPSHRLTPEPKTGITPLAVATNVDVGMDGELSRRAGYSEVLDTCHKNLHQSDGFLLATVDGGDLTAMNAAGGARVTLYRRLASAVSGTATCPTGAPRSATG